MSDERRMTQLVVARELRESFRRKAIWITAAVVLVGVCAIMIVPELVGDSSDRRTVAVVGSASPTLERAIDQAGLDRGLRIELEPVADRAAARKAVEDDDANVALVLDDGDPVIIGESVDDQVATAVRQALATERTTNQLQALGLDPSQIEDSLAAPAVSFDDVGKDRGGRIAAATIASLGMYLLLFIVTTQVANGVAIEKSNRISEVLLAIAPTRSLLFGKVIGVGLVGLIPLAAGLLPVIVKLVAGGSLPPSIGSVLASSAAWFLLGAGLYLLSGAALGALVERQEEVGSAVGGLSLVLIASYLVGQSAADTPVGLVLAYLPFTSPMVEPARLALGVSSPVEVIGSLAISVVTLVLVARLAATVYRRAVVRAGRRLHLRDVLRPVPA